MGMYEDYLNRVPLNERLARLNNGDEEDPAPEEAQPAWSGRPDLRPLDDEDRRHLRRMSFEPGWPILLRLLDRRIQKIEDSAKQASKTNPAAKDENAAKWAEVAAMEETRKALVGMMNEEIALIGKENDEKPAKTAKKKAAKRTQ